MKCPGQDSRYWKEDAIYEAKCPKCGQPVEFFKDDTSRKCPDCAHRFPNPHLDFGCAAYCQYAEQCLGNLPEEVKDKQQELIKDKVAMEVRKYLKNEPELIKRANTVAQYAEQIGKEEGADLGTVIMAAYLQNMGNREAKDKYTPDDSWPEKPTSARQILESFQLQEDIIRQVCALVRFDQQNIEENLNAKVLSDAILLADLQKELTKASQDSKADQLIEQSTLATESARKLAAKIMESK
jgi:hypothetical protein